MATHGSHGAPSTSTLPAAVPLDLQYLTRQSWELGARIVDGAPTLPRGEWRHTSGSWALAAFEATDETAVLRLRTPAGCTRFYGVTREEFREALPALVAAPDWEPAE